MKIGFPVEQDNGLESTVYGHFGSAPVFIVVDTETNSSEVVQNQDLGHEHGMCEPLKALGEKVLDVVIVGGIGAGALMKLRDLNIAVYQALPGTVEQNIQLFKSKVLPEMSTDHACNHHGHGEGGCSH